MNKKTTKELIDAVVKFREDRDWQRLVSFKNIAIAINLEAAEVLDHFQWKTDEENKKYVKKHKKEIEEEIMDVLFNVFLMADVLETDIDIAFFEKMKKNNKKYPVEKVKGKNPHL